MRHLLVQYRPARDSSGRLCVAYSGQAWIQLLAPLERCATPGTGWG